MKALKLVFAASLVFVGLSFPCNRAAQTTSVGDNKTGEIALLELGLKNDELKRATDGCFVGANFPVTDKLTREETRFDHTKKDSSPNARRARWNALMDEHKGKIDVESARAFENDDFDVITGKHGTNERTLCEIGRAHV